MTNATPLAPGPDRAVFAGLVALLFALPLPWGSNIDWAADLFCALAGLLLAAWLGLAALGRAGLPARPRRLWWALLLWLAWLGWIALQLLPMDAGALAQRSPAAHGMHAALLPEGVTPLYTLSISPSATADALLLSLGLFALYWLVVLTACGDDRRIRIVLLTLVVSGLAQATYGAVMTLSGLEYGFFARKLHYLGKATGTFVNRNHFAGYLELTAAAGIGLILADFSPPKGERSWRQVLGDWINFAFSDKVRVRLALVIMLVGLVLSRSRMGNLAFFAALCLCGVGYVAVRERALAGKAAILFLSMLVVDTWIVSRWFGFEQVIERLETTELTDESRVRLLEALPPVIDAYADRGSGLGTFASAFAPFRSPSMTEYFDHAHNDYAQLLIEVGLPGLMILMALAGVHYLHALRLIVLRRRRFPAAVGFATLMALTAYALHCLVEFNLQVPANAATLVALLAAAACCSSRARSRSKGAQVETAEPASARAPAKSRRRRRYGPPETGGPTTPPPPPGVA